MVESMVTNHHQWLKLTTQIRVHPMYIHMSCPLLNDDTHVPLTVSSEASRNKSMGVNCGHSSWLDTVRIEVKSN